MSCETTTTSCDRTSSPSMISMTSSSMISMTSMTSSMMSTMFMWEKAKIVLHEMLIDQRGYFRLCQHATKSYILFLFKKSCVLSSSSPDTLPGTIKPDTLPGAINPDIMPGTINPDTIIYLCEREKLNIDGLKEVIETLQSFQIKKCLLVYKSMMTASSKKALDHMFDYDIELWNLSELQYNLTKHSLYIPHERLRDSEIAKCIQEIDIPRLPKISKNDPVVRFFGWKRNYVLRIHRKDGSIAYRIVK